MNEENLNNGTGRWRAAFLKPQASSLKPAAALVGVALILVLTTAASADPIRFDNAPVGDPDHFAWGRPEGDNTNFLDITQPYDAQPGEPYGDRTLRHKYNATESAIGTASNAGVLIEMEGLWIGSLELGDMIPSGASTSYQGYVYYEGYATPVPEDVPAYLGVHFDMGAGTQYGWIGFVRSGAQCDAFAWGYETTPDTPIAAGVPEPATLAMLALGAVGVLRRR